MNGSPDNLPMIGVKVPNYYFADTTEFMQIDIGHTFTCNDHDTLYLKTEDHKSVAIASAPNASWKPGTIMPFDKMYPVAPAHTVVTWAPEEPKKEQKVNDRTW